MPVVGECDDGFLNDLRGMHVREEHVRAALDGAADGPVAEGCVGAGTGMSCFDFKAGIGTSSRARLRPRPHVDGGRAGADQLRRAPPPAASTACPSAARSPTSCRSRTARARASSCSPPTRRSARGSASAWPSAARSAWRRPAVLRLRRQRRDHARVHHGAPRAARLAAEPLALATVANDQMYGALRGRGRRDRRERLQLAHRRDHHGRPRRQHRLRAAARPPRRRRCAAPVARRGCPERSPPCRASPWRLR